MPLKPHLNMYAVTHWPLQKPTTGTDHTPSCMLTCLHPLLNSGSPSHNCFAHLAAVRSGMTGLKSAVATPRPTNLKPSCLNLQQRLHPVECQSSEHLWGVTCCQLLGVMNNVLLYTLYFQRIHVFGFHHRQMSPRPAILLFTQFVTIPSTWHYV
jgi:hypothetical protein